MNGKTTGGSSARGGGRRSESFGLYSHPEVYDLAYARSLAGDIRFFGLVFKGLASRPVRRIIDFGCGTGRLATELARCGYECLGIDARREMVAFARRAAAQEGVPLEFQVGRMESIVSGGDWDAALCVTGTLHHLDGVRDLSKHFCSVAGALSVGGVYVVEVLVTRDEDEPVEVEQEWSVSEAGRQVQVAFWFDSARHDFQGNRRWATLEATVVDGCRRKSYRNEHWFAVITAGRLLCLAGRAGLRHVGWYTGHGGLRQVRHPHRHPGVYAVFVKE